MKTFKFKVTEYWIGGVKEGRILEVKAKTLASALKKVNTIKGNRDWNVEAI